MERQSRKRPRPVVSCLRCRDKKLKCDRLNPCQNCTKTGNGCIFESAPPPKKRVHLPPESNTQTPYAAAEVATANPAIGIIEDLQQRMLKLEKLLAVKTSAPAAIQQSWPVPLSGIANEDPPYLGTLVVKGERSRWHGMNDRITLLNQFAEAKAFINQSLEDPSLVGLAKEVQFLQSRSQASFYSPQSLSDLEKFPELNSLLGCLPPKEICDRLLHVYTTNFEKIFRILHIPSFYQHYAKFWTTAYHDDPSFLSMFVPLLTALLSISVMVDTEPYAPECASYWEYLKQTAVGSVKTWMEKLPRKSRTDFATLQVRGLLLLARQLRLAPTEELWRESGSLVRSGMVMGLHIDTSKSPEISVFQAELRRRLWVAIVELDLQTSMAAGMPMMTPGLSISSLIPSNLNDGDFEEAFTELPVGKPLDEETDSLQQIVLAQSLTQRIRMMDLSQHTTPQENLEERLRQSRKLAEELNQMPSFLKPDYQSGTVDRASTLNRVLLDIHLRRPLLCLLRPVTSSKNQDDPSFPEIQQLCLESSMTLLSYQDLFDPNLVDLDTPNANTYWNIFQTFFQNDILWAALGVCEYLKLVNHQSSTQSPSSEALDTNSKASSSTSFPLKHNKASLIRLVENTLETLTRRIGEKGTNMKDVLLLSVVLQSVRSRGSSDQKQRHMSQGAKKALSACRSNLLSTANEAILPYFGMQMATEPMAPPPDISGQFGQELTMPNLLEQSATLAAEFDSFQGDLFTFDDGSFMWNT